jgi:hypothetical protein
MISNNECSFKNLKLKGIIFSLRDLLIFIIILKYKAIAYVNKQYKLLMRQRPNSPKR